MWWKKTLSLTARITLLIFVIFLFIYAIIWLIIGERMFHPIEQIRGFTIPFIVYRWYDIGLICLWPMVIIPLYKKTAPLFQREKLKGPFSEDHSHEVFIGFATIMSFLVIGLPLSSWSNGSNIFSNSDGILIFIIPSSIGWIFEEIFLLNRGSRKLVITEGITINIFIGLGMAFAFIFSKGLLLGLFFGFATTVAITILLLIYNLIFKSLWRLANKSDQDKKLITKVE